MISWQTGEPTLRHESTHIVYGQPDRRSVMPSWVVIALWGALALALLALAVAIGREFRLTGVMLVAVACVAIGWVAWRVCPGRKR